MHSNDVTEQLDCPSYEQRGHTVLGIVRNLQGWRLCKRLASAAGVLFVSALLFADGNNNRAQTELKSNSEKIVKTICSIAELYDHVPKGKTRADVPALAKDKLVELCAYGNEEIGMAADILNDNLESEPGQVYIVFRVFLLLAYDINFKTCAKPLLCWPHGVPGRDEPEQDNPWHKVGTHSWQVYPVSWVILGENVLPRSTWKWCNTFPRRQSPGFWCPTSQIAGEEQVLLQSFKNCRSQTISQFQVLVGSMFSDYTMRRSSSEKTLDVSFYVPRKAYYAYKDIGAFLNQLDKLRRGHHPSAFQAKR